MFHTKTTRENALHRLKIIKGHLNKIIEMVESDAYCIDVLTQTRAVQQALAKVDDVLLESHLNHCVVEHIQHGHAKQATEEIMKVFKKRGL